MLVDSEKLKDLRRTRNWTQEYLADVCDLSVRTIQRVEKDGVASNETIAAYASVFELAATELLVSVDCFEQNDRKVAMPAVMLAALILISFIIGVVCALLFL